MKQELIDKLLIDKSYSIRRAFVDDFFFQNINVFNEQASILDMGGKKENKRGAFNIENYNFNVKYANIDKSTKPDFLCDIKKIPVADNTFDGVILSEVIEHLSEPILVLEEAFRVLKKGGKLLIVTPFIYHVHADPYDYGRYTDYWYKEKLKTIGFEDIRIEKQGLFFAVLVNMLKLYNYELFKIGKPKNLVLQKTFDAFIKLIIKKSFLWDAKKFIKSNSVTSNYTTGFGVIGKKSC